MMSVFAGFKVATIEMNRRQQRGKVALRSSFFGGNTCVHDELLKPYLAARNERDAERILGQLAETYLRPLVTHILCHILGRNDEDGVQAILVTLIERIRKARAEKAPEPIRSLKAYAIITAKHEGEKRGRKHQQEAEELSLEAARENAGWEVEATEADPAIEIERQESLRLVWCELKKIAPKRLQTLLLDFHETDVTPLDIFQFRGIASLQELATAMEMPVKRLNTVLMTLPWQDDQIAAELGLGIQVVRNYRTQVRKQLRENLSGRQGPHSR